MDKQILPLYKDISRNGVTVPADVQSLTIAFVAPDYINGENYEYSYQLVNYNSSWEKLQKTNKVTFMNLPYGEYLLKSVIATMSLIRQQKNTLYLSRYYLLFI